MELDEEACQVEWLGEPIRMLAVQSAIAWPSEAPEALALVLRGRPAQLVVLALPGFELRASHVLPHAEGAENLLVSSRVELFIPTHPHGKLYRYSLAANQLHEIHHGCDRVGLIWDLAEDHVGRIFAGCWPGARLFAFDPSTQKTIDFESVAPGEDYVRAMTSCAATRRLYLGIGAHAQLLEYDPIARTSSNILPPMWQSQRFVYQLASYGTWLFVTVMPARKTLVFRLGAQSELVAELAALECPHIVPREREGKRLLLAAGGHLVEFDTQAQLWRVIAPEVAGKAKLLCRLGHASVEDTSHVVLVHESGDVTVVDISARKHCTRGLSLAPQALPIHNLALGPAGRIYSSGYVMGGVGIFDPLTQSFDFFNGVGQAEAIAHDGESVYFGTYPEAAVVAYRPDGLRSETNRRTLLTLAEWEQDRPYALLPDPTHHRLFIGTVPAYGCLGGALAIYDLTTGEVRVRRHIVPDQSIVSLVKSGNLVIGGTSVSGGLGVAPRARSACLFVLDPEHLEIRRCFMPVEGARGITGLVADSGGNVYGWAEGTLFVFEPQRGEISWSQKFFDETWPKTHYWRGIIMRAAPDEPDVFYGAAWGTLFQFRAGERALRILARIPEADVVAPAGRKSIYTMSGTQLIRVRVV